ncbi:hypothetical protein BDM02DRAFT_1939069 [Thelephora ganbajun]|uniref:Uncharacterized protein n=1 Tax=Thelephora ganbajun TaxID=370292 RepID=A0ACB6YZ77_THEGA|nr:hypothetical protein BDM02DRAFT_1939069 [Thelephora ganbajun]
MSTRLSNLLLLPSLRSPPYPVLHRHHPPLPRLGRYVHRWTLGFSFVFTFLSFIRIHVQSPVWRRHRIDSEFALYEIVKTLQTPGGPAVPQDRLPCILNPMFSTHCHRYARPAVRSLFQTPWTSDILVSGLPVCTVELSLAESGGQW